MKTLFLATCFWHTAILHRNTVYKVDLKNQPGKEVTVHVNGQLWKAKVLKTRKVCK